MKIFKEIDVVKTTKSVDVWVANDSSRLILPPGTQAAVVLVYGPAEAPTAYELEFYLSDRESFALATVEAEFVTSAS